MQNKMALRLISQTCPSSLPSFILISREHCTVLHTYVLAFLCPWDLKWRPRLFKSHIDVQFGVYYQCSKFKRNQCGNIWAEQNMNPPPPPLLFFCFLFTYVRVHTLNQWKTIAKKVHQISRPRHHAKLYPDQLRTLQDNVLRSLGCLMPLWPWMKLEIIQSSVVTVIIPVLKGMGLVPFRGKSVLGFFVFFLTDWLLHSLTKSVD